MAIITKGELMLLLGNDLDAFTSFLFSPDGTHIKWQFEQAEGFDCGNKLILDKFNMLASVGIIKEETVKNILDASAVKDAQEALNNSVIISNKIRYKVTVPKEVINKLEWVSQFATKDISVAITDEFLYVEAEPNTFNCPYSVEV